MSATCRCHYQTPVNVRVIPEEKQFEPRTHDQAVLLYHQIVEAPQQLVENEISFLQKLTGNLLWLVTFAALLSYGFLSETGQSLLAVSHLLFSIGYCWWSVTFGRCMIARVIGRLLLRVGIPIKDVSDATVKINELVPQMLMAVQGAVAFLVSSAVFFENVGGAHFMRSANALLAFLRSC